MTAASPSVTRVMAHVMGSSARKVMIAPSKEIRPAGRGRVLQRSTCASRLRSQISLGIVGCGQANYCSGNSLLECAKGDVGGSHAGPDPEQHHGEGLYAKRDFSSASSDACSPDGWVPAQPRLPSVETTQLPHGADDVALLAQGRLRRSVAKSLSSHDGR